MSYSEYTQRNIDEAVSRAVDDLQVTADGLAEENTELGQKLDAAHATVKSAINDLRAIDDVPFGQVAAYVEAVVTELRKVLL